MKDAYSLDRDAEGMEERYALHVGAYDRIMDRTAFAGTTSRATSE